MMDPLSGTILAKPAYYMIGNKNISIWSKEHLLLKKITEYILACTFAFQTGTLVLMQAFWSHLGCQMGSKSFMRSWEFKFYIGWAFVSMVTLPLARGLTANDIVLVETVPQLIFSIQLFVIFLLGIRNDKKLNNLLITMKQQSLLTGQEEIHYFIEINNFLILGTLMTSIGFLVISIDAIAKINYITKSKFLMDLFIIHANFGSLILWVTMILIIYPRRIKDFERHILTDLKVQKRIKDELILGNRIKSPRRFLI